MALRRFANMGGNDPVVATVRKLVIGCNDDPLDISRTEQLIEKINSKFPGVNTAIKPIPFEGNSKTCPLAHLGSHLEQALAHGKVQTVAMPIDLLPGKLRSGVVIAAITSRQAAPFWLLTPPRRSAKLDAIKKKGKVQTSSILAAIQIRRYRPDLEVKVVKRSDPGAMVKHLTNKGTDGLVVDYHTAGALLALPDIKCPMAPIPVAQILPAPGSGAIAAVVRWHDTATRMVVAGLTDPNSAPPAAAERAFAEALEAEEGKVYGAHCEPLDNGQLKLTGIIANANGRPPPLVGEETGFPSVSEQLGHDLATRLLNDIDFVSS